MCSFLRRRSLPDLSCTLSPLSTLLTSKPVQSAGASSFGPLPVLVTVGPVDEELLELPVIFTLDALCPVDELLDVPESGITLKSDLSSDVSPSSGMSSPLSAFVLGFVTSRSFAYLSPALALAVGWSISFCLCTLKPPRLPAFLTSPHSPVTRVCLVSSGGRLGFLKQAGQVGHHTGPE